MVSDDLARLESWPAHESLQFRLVRDDEVCILNAEALKKGTLPMQHATFFPAETDRYRTYEVKLSKGEYGDRYNVSIDGEHLGWILKDTDGKTWIAYTSRNDDDRFKGYQVAWTLTRKEALDELLFWLKQNDWRIDRYGIEGRRFDSLPFTAITEDEWMEA